jgi:hypothetical protein
MQFTDWHFSYPRSSPETNYWEKGCPSALAPSEMLHALPLVWPPWEVMASCMIDLCWIVVLGWRDVSWINIYASLVKLRLVGPVMLVVFSHWPWLVLEQVPAITAFNTYFWKLLPVVTTLRLCHLQLLWREHINLDVLMYQSCCFQPWVTFQWRNSAVLKNCEGKK